MLIVSWNVNSINVRIEQLIVLIKELSPDIILLQELKCIEENFPHEILDNQGQICKYNIIVYGQKSYNGVAIMSKKPILEWQKHDFAVTKLNEVHHSLAKNLNFVKNKKQNHLQSTFNIKLNKKTSTFNICNFQDKNDYNDEYYSETIDVEKDIPLIVKEARYIEAVIPYNNVSTIRVGSVYVPNGSEVKSPKFTYKLAFYDEMTQHMINLLKYDEMIVIGGDMNVAPEAIDTYDPIKMEGTLAFHPEEKSRFYRMITNGYHDSFRLYKPKEQEFSWWDYRDRNSLINNRGMRIDHILVDSRASTYMLEASIHRDFRSITRPSDHAPISIRLNSCNV